VAIVLANLSDCNKAGALAIDPCVIKFLAQKTAETLTGEEDRWSLLTFVNGIANLAANDSNKEVIGQSGIIKSLFDILQVDSKKCPHGRVLTYLEESKTTAATALWNLAYHEPNVKKMRELGGVEVLRDLIVTTADDRLKKNAKGTLWLLGLREESKHEGRETSHTASAETEKKDRAEINEEGPSVNKEKTDPFIYFSYSPTCHEVVSSMAGCLKNNGYKVWPEAEQSNVSSLEIISDAIENACVVILCMMDAYKDSPLCRIQAEYVATLRKDYILIKLEEEFKFDGWLSGLFDDRAAFDFSKVEDDYQDNMSLLIVELGLRGKVGAVVPELLPTPVSFQLSIRLWNVDQVGLWLEKNNLEKYKEAFTRNDVDGMALVGLVNLLNRDIHSVYEVLCQLGVQSIGHRLKLVVLLKDFQL